MVVSRIFSRSPLSAPRSAVGAAVGPPHRITPGPLRSPDTGGCGAQRTRATVASTVTDALSHLSAAIVALAAAAEPWLAAIRVAPNQHITGIAWGDGLIVATEQSLPARVDYSLVLPGGSLAAGRVVQRDPAANLALLRLDRPALRPRMAFATAPAVGTLVAVVGADFDGSPTVRLTTVHRKARGPDQGPTLDLPAATADPGALALDPAGAVLGVVTVAPGGTVAIVPHRAIGRFMGDAPRTGAAKTNDKRTAIEPPRRAPAPAPANVRRGWLGVALQPITVPEPLVGRAGQASGRLVVGVSAGGPAEQAGLRIGDVLLSVDGHNTSGQNALRTFLESSRIGTDVEARILRDTAIETVWLSVAEQP